MPLVFALAESSIVGWGVTVRTGKFPVQASLGAWPGSGRQLLYQVPGNQAKIVKT